MAPAIPMEGLSTMERLISDSVATPRLITVAVGSFAVLALLLAVVGVYGVLSYMVGLRRDEFGIRQALGADGDAIQSLVLRQGLSLAVVAGFPPPGPRGRTRRRRCGRSDGRPRGQGRVATR
mgnify:CR=1 FL=1